MTGDEPGAHTETGAGSKALEKLGWRMELQWALTNYGRRFPSRRRLPVETRGFHTG